MNFKNPRETMENINPRETMENIKVSKIWVPEEKLAEKVLEVGSI